MRNNEEATMIRSAVTISLVAEAMGGPFVFWHDLPEACRKAQQLGFDGIEIFPPSPDAIDVSLVRKLLSDHGLTLAAMGTGGGWVKQRLSLTHPDATTRSKAKAFIKSIIECAGSLGAPAIIGSMQGRTGDGVDFATAMTLLWEALEELGEFAKPFGVPLLYEPLNRYETDLIKTVEMGVKSLESLSTKNVKLLADLFHMNIEEANIADALRLGAGFIGHVHFVDSNRRPAGLGHIDYAPIAKALQETGYTGFVSAEAFPYPDSDAAAKQTIETFRRVFQS